MNSRKLSRRDAVKALAVAGAALAATPYLARAAGAEQVTPRELGEGPENVALNPHPEGPLIVLVRDNELLGFRGMEEIHVKDMALISQIQRSFQFKGAD